MHRVLDEKCRHLSLNFSVVWLGRIYVGEMYVSIEYLQFNIYNLSGKTENKLSTSDI